MVSSFPMLQQKLLFSNSAGKKLTVDVLDNIPWLTVQENTEPVEIAIAYDLALPDALQGAFCKQLLLAETVGVVSLLLQGCEYVNLICDHNHPSMLALLVALFHPALFYHKITQKTSVKYA